MRGEIRLFPSHPTICAFLHGQSRSTQFLFYWDSAQSRCPCGLASNRITTDVEGTLLRMFRTAVMRNLQKQITHRTALISPATIMRIPSLSDQGISQARLAVPNIEVAAPHGVALQPSIRQSPYRFSFQQAENYSKRSHAVAKSSERVLAVSTQTPINRTAAGFSLSAVESLKVPTLASERLCTRKQCEQRRDNVPRRRLDSLFMVSPCSDSVRLSVQ